MFQWNPTWPRLAYELHRFLVDYQCRDRIYMLSPRATPVSDASNRSLRDFTGLAEDAAAGSVDAVITQTRVDGQDIPVCHVMGPGEARFGVVTELSAMAGEAAAGLIRSGCQRLRLALTGVPSNEPSKVWGSFQRALADAGLRCPQDSLSGSEGSWSARRNPAS